MSKRGLGHLEAVLSIVLFIIAVFIIIQFFFPSDSQNVSDQLSKELFDSIKQNASADYTTYVIKINNTEGQIIGNILSINISENLINKNLTVTNFAQIKLDSRILDYQNGIFCVRTTGNDNLITVSIAENLSNDLNLNSPCPVVDERYYQIVSKEIRKIFLENDLLDIREKCLSDYNSIKKQFNLDPSIDFAFNVQLSDKTISCDKKILQNIQVNSLNTRVEILRYNGKIEYANFNLRIW